MKKHHQRLGNSILRRRILINLNLLTRPRKCHLIDQHHRRGWSSPISLQTWWTVQRRKESSRKIIPDTTLTPWLISWWGITTVVWIVIKNQNQEYMGFLIHQGGRGIRKNILSLQQEKYRVTIWASSNHLVSCRGKWLHFMKLFKVAEKSSSREVIPLLSLLLKVSWGKLIRKRIRRKLSWWSCLQESLLSRSKNNKN